MTTTARAKRADAACATTLWNKPSHGDAAKNLKSLSQRKKTRAAQEVSPFSYQYTAVPTSTYFVVEGCTGE